MQTLFLVWLPGLGAALAGGGVFVWLGGKAVESLARARQMRGGARAAINSAYLLKEVCGSNVIIPDDLQRRIDRQIAEVETVTRKELT